MPDANIQQALDRVSDAESRIMAELRRELPQPPKPWGLWAYRIAVVLLLFANLLGVWFDKVFH